MTNYTAHEIEQAIENHEDFEGWGEIKYETKGSAYLAITLGEETLDVITTDSFGGEGQGDEIWVVVQIGSQYFEKGGYYSSAYGSEWDGDLTEVKPVEKTVTVYESL